MCADPDPFPGSAQSCFRNNGKEPDPPTTHDKPVPVPVPYTSVADPDPGSKKCPYGSGSGVKPN